MKQIELFLILLTSLYTLVLPDTYSIGEASMYTYMVLLVLDVIRIKRFTVFQVWIAAFIFVICSDIIIYQPNNDTWSTIYIINANSMLLLGYFINIGSNREQRLSTHNDNIPIGRKKRSVELLIFAMMIWYVYSFALSAVSSLLFGRIHGDDAEMTETQFLGEIIASIGMILPAISSYYYRIYRREKKYMPWVVSLPIFIILFMNGTRFPLLFSVLGFVIAGNLININRITPKSLISIIVCAAFVLGATQYMKTIRGKGIEGDRKIEQGSSAQMQLTDAIANMMSQEYIIECLNFEHKYFDENPYTYGVSTGFVFYFWIPRMIWPDKPTQLGYWMIRKESVVSDSQNNSYGFVGEPYADFGYFSLIIIFLFGVGLKKIEIFQLKCFSNLSPSLIMGAMLYPYVFFFVRSPVTASTRLLGMFVWYMVFVFLINRKVKTKRIMSSQI